MTIKTFIALALTVVTLNAQAEAPAESLMLWSTQKDQGSIWTSERSFHFKSFDAMLLNGGQKDVDLSKLCFQAYDAKGNAYHVDTIDESLVQGVLKPGKAVRGFYQFTGDDGVYSASMVKVLRSCK
ncbi:DUF4354 family protein [Pseudomonas sp. RT6P73]